VPIDAGFDARAEHSALESERVDAAQDVPQTPVICESTGFFCQEYVGVAPPASCVPSPGPCPLADPSDICVVGPGHFEFFYHSIIPTDGGAGIRYGLWPPDDCVHPQSAP
jgi:hypothetical protein